jgi:GxxExxY protein
MIRNRAKIVYPELSYDILGCAFRVFNESGYGYSEKFYQKAFEKELEGAGILYVREQSFNVTYRNEHIGSYKLDFLVDNKVVVDLKVRPRFGYVHVKQVVGYLRATKHQLAILIYFTRDGVKYRRIINLQ